MRGAKVKAKLSEDQSKLMSEGELGELRKNLRERKSQNPEKKRGGLVGRLRAKVGRRGTKGKEK